MLGAGLRIEVEPEITKRSSGEIGRPDFSIVGPEQTTFVDATRFRFGVLAEWEKSSDLSVSRLGDRLGVADLGRVVTIRLPLEARSVPLTEAEASAAAAAVLARESGNLTLRNVEPRLNISWRTVPVVARGKPAKATIYAKFVKPGDLLAAPPGLMRMVSIQTTDMDMVFVEPPIPNPCSMVITQVSAGVSAIIYSIYPEVEATDLLLNSIRQRACEKLKQIDVEGPIFDFSPQFLQLLITRMWPNELFRRISGLAVFEPRTTFQAVAGGQPKQIAKMSLNPNASNPLPPALLRSFGAGAL